MSSRDNNSHDHDKKQPHKDDAEDSGETAEKEEEEDEDTGDKEEMEIEGPTLTEIEKNNLCNGEK